MRRDRQGGEGKGQEKRVSRGRGGCEKERKREKARYRKEGRRY